MFGFSDAAIRLVVTLLAIGFPILLIFSWVFELTPEGLKLEKNIDPAVSVTHHTSKKLDRIIIILLALVLGYFAFDKFVLDPARDTELVEETAQQTRSDVMLESYGDNSIAVLAFADMSPEGDQEYFSDGISEELLNLLSKAPGLRVISRSSAFTFKGKDIDIPTIAKQLNVAYILEGSVRKAGNQVRITAQLIEARSDTHLWSETYDRELEIIFVVQDEFSAAIVGVLKEKMGLKVEALPTMLTAANTDAMLGGTATSNTEAHDAYLRGRHLVVQRGTAAVEGAVREFEKAVVLDPDYAPAHAELAIATLLLISYGDLARTEAIAKAAPHIEQALTLAPTLAEAHAAAGFLSLVQENHEEALSHFRLAIKINPNYSIVYVWMGLVYWNTGRYKEDFAMTEMALRFDPLSVTANNNHLVGLIFRMRLDEAALLVEKMTSIYPDKGVLYRSMLSSLGGNWTDPLIGRLDFLSRNAGDRKSNSALAHFFALIGLEQEVLALSEYLDPYELRWLGKPNDAVTLTEVRLAERPESLRALGALGLALASAGDYERARPILEKVWQRLGRVTSSDPTASAFIAHSAAALIVIRRSAGEKSGVTELVAAIRDNVRRYQEAGFRNDSFLIGPSPDYEEGLAAYLSGEPEKGLALIDKAVSDGFFIPQYEAYLQTLYDDQGFAPIREMQEARQTRERNKFLTIVCTDNPYEDVWQPAEGTCERFAAEQKNDSLQ
jgi:TolB-like protein